MRPGGTLVVDEFDVARFDEPSAAWLARPLARDGPRAGRHPPTSSPSYRAHLHPLDAIRAGLGEWFELGPVTRASYLYRWYLGEELRAAEEELIADGVAAGAGCAVRGGAEDG